MTKLVDIVNLNADASCLSSEVWMSMLRGGDQSPLVSHLRSYVRLRKKVTLGVIGATVADLTSWNPEAIDLINAHRDIFEIILRPFSHDVALLRTNPGFELNFKYGRRTLERAFGNVEPYFLPPEFMLTNNQLALLAKLGVEGVFVNASRFSKEVARKLPSVPYWVKGVNQVKLRCFPCAGELTRMYLDGLHCYHAQPWNEAMARQKVPVTFSWRDGESPFLIPDGIEREKAWLESESTDIQRIFVSEASRLADFEAPNITDQQIAYYPVHSFLAWVKEFRMLGFVQRIHSYETELDNLSSIEKRLWLSLINSDILSAVEKSSPVVRLFARNSSEEQPFTIWRSERGFEGEEFMYILDNLAQEPHLLDQPLVHVVRLKARLNYLKSLDGEN